MFMLYEYGKCCYHSLPLAYLFSRTLTHLLPVVNINHGNRFQDQRRRSKTIKEVIEIIILV